MKYIVDSNVPLLAGTPVSKIPHDQAEAARICNAFIKDLIENVDSKIVLDASWEILREYGRAINVCGRGPNTGKIFYRWVCANIRHMDANDLVVLHKDDQNSFEEYPKHKGLKNFDPSDRKFIALANAHPEHPPIVQGTDCKWWGIRIALEECGIHVRFLCEAYIKQKFEQKIGI